LGGLEPDLLAAVLQQVQEEQAFQSVEFLGRHGSERESARKWW
jgi:hypothetical protein